MDYLAYRQQKVLCNYTINVSRWPTIANPRPNKEVRIEDESLGLSALNITSIFLVSAFYGSDGLIKEVGISALGLSGTASDLALFIGHFAVQEHGPRASDKSRLSSIAGGLAYTQSRTDGVD